MEFDRSAILRNFGIEDSVAALLLGSFQRDLPKTLPIQDAASTSNEIFVPDWITCCLEAREKGAVPALRDLLYELNFPIAGGISGTPEYQNLALAGSGSLQEVRGRLSGSGPSWQDPEGIRVYLHDTGSGLLPVIETNARADFITLVRAIVHRNEPAAIPASMGSSFINGYTNRGRYLQVRRALEWSLIPAGARDPKLWKDKFLILGPGSYSGVPATGMRLSQEEWNRISTQLRLHHESCHYLVRRHFPRLKFGLQDELVADFAGLMGSTGSFQAEDFLRFTGWEAYPRYRAGGRMENYDRSLWSHPGTTEAAGRLLHAAAYQLQNFFAGWPAPQYQFQQNRILLLLTWLPLEALASPGAPHLLQEFLAPPGIPAATLSVT